MNNIAVCVVSYRWQMCHFKKKTGFSKWAMGAQAEALVPSIMWYVLFSRILYVPVILNSYRT